MRSSVVLVSVVLVIVCLASVTSVALFGESPPTPAPANSYSEMSGKIDNSLEGQGESGDFEVVRKRVQENQKVQGKKDAIETVEAELARLREIEAKIEERKQRDEELRRARQRTAAAKSAQEAEGKRKKIRAAMAKEVDDLPYVSKSDLEWRGLD